MTTAYTSLLGLALPVTGELQGTWGDTVNNYITSYLDAAVAGTQTLSTDADVTLTKTTNASLSSTSSQYSILLFSGARTAQRTVTVPAASKIYTVINNTTGGFAVKVVAAGPTTGLTIANGEKALIAWNGSDFVRISNTAGSGSFTDLTATGVITFNTTTNSQSYTTTGAGTITISSGTAGSINNMNIGATTAGTGKFTALTNTALTSGRVVYSTTGGLETDSANLTFDGTTLTAGGLSTGGSLTLSGGTANGVLYLNGSKVVTSGTALTFDGTTLGTNRFSMTGFLATFNNDNFYMEFQRSGTPFGYIGTGSNTAGGAVTDLGVRAQNNLVFAANATEQMRLTSTGLGIGTSSPSNKLSISGRMDFTAYSTHMDTWGMWANSTDGTTISAYTGYPITFRIANAQKMQLDVNGNLGLGVTPSAWNTNVPVRGFQIGSATSLYDAGITYGSGLAYNFYSSNSGDKYLNNGYASSYVQKTGQHIWFTAASGTAGNAISFTQAMTLDASGNLLVGTTTPLVNAGNRGNITVNGSTDSVLAFGIGAATAGYIYQGPSTLIINTQSTRAITFETNGTERARIDSSGSLLVNSTSAIRTRTGQVQIQAVSTQEALVTSSNDLTYSQWAARSADSGAGTHYLAYFEKSTGTTVGSITHDNTNTAYNTSSDYRLKDNPQPLTGSGAFIDSLKPKTWTWKESGSKGVGFIAHEVQEVSPGSVIGEKDAIDEEGNPKYQAMEYGSAEFIANIIAELQQLRARVAQLEKGN